MMFSDLIELLKQRDYEKKKIEDLWDNLCQKIVVSVMSMYHSFKLVDMKGSDGSFFHIYAMDFLLGEDLNAWCININSDPTFSKKNNIFDEYKEDIIQEIAQNATLKFIKNICYTDFVEMVTKEHNKKKLEDITKDIMQATKMK